MMNPAQRTPALSVTLSAEEILNRRAFLRLAGVTAASLPLASVLAACGDDDDSTDTAGTDDAGEDTTTGGTAGDTTGGTTDGDNTAPTDETTGGDTTSGAGDTGDDTTGDTTGADTSGDTAGETTGGDIPEGPGAVRDFPPAVEGATEQTLSFVHVNDIHAGYTPGKGAESPIARLRAYYDQVRAENPFTVFSNAGDDFEKGSIIEPLSDGQAVIELTRAMKFHVRTIGNHDFAWGAQHVLDYSRDDFSLVVNSNIQYTGPNPAQWGAQPYAELQVGAVKVGFFGLVSKPWNERNQQYDGDFLPDFPSRFDYLDQVKAAITAHRAKCDVLVFVSHLGYGEDLNIAKNATGLDVILGGHSHSVLSKENVTNGTIIIQCGSSGTWIGRLDLVIDTATKKIKSHTYNLRLSAPLTISGDAAIQQKVDALVQKHGPDIHDPVATLENRGSAEAMAAVYAAAAKTQLATDAAICGANQTYNEIGSGEITPQEIYTVFYVEMQPAGTPGFNAIYKVRAKGSVLKAIQSSGKADTFTFIGPAAIDDNTVYTVALPKMYAFNPTVYLAPDIAFENDPEFASEAWRVLIDYAKARTVAGKHLDTDTAV